MKDNKKTYPPNWVVMQNNIQECFKSMNIDEKRMLILASPIARTTHATEKDQILITAEEFANNQNRHCFAWCCIHFSADISN